MNQTTKRKAPSGRVVLTRTTRKHKHRKYFSNKIQKGKTCYSEEQVISMLDFLIDNISVSFGGILFQQVVGIPMGTNCAPLLDD
jgi:hypothetical protein